MRIQGFDSIDQLITKFNKFDTDSEHMFNEALFDGAAVVADEVRNRISSIPIQERTRRGGTPQWGTSKRRLDGITSIQKQGLESGLGIANFKNEGGTITTAIGFEGYNADGEPNPKIARSVESGSSIRNKHPFVRPALNAAKGRAEEAMKKKILDKVKEI